ncbi:MAG: hypothetical protein ACREGR_02905 [Minisyncoccia bacterium]
MIPGSPLRASRNSVKIQLAINSFGAGLGNIDPHVIYPDNGALTI